MGLDEALTFLIFETKLNEQNRVPIAIGYCSGFHGNTRHMHDWTMDNLWCWLFGDPWWPHHIQGVHRDCKCLVAVKRLGINAEARMLQWLVAGLRCPDGRDGGPVHKQTSLRLQLIPFHAMSCNLPMQGYPFLLARFDLKNQSYCCDGFMSILAFTHWSGSVFFRPVVVISNTKSSQICDSWSDDHVSCALVEGGKHTWAWLEDAAHFYLAALQPPSFCFQACSKWCCSLCYQYRILFALKNIILCSWSVQAGCQELIISKKRAKLCTQNFEPRFQKWLANRPSSLHHKKSPSNLHDNRTTKYVCPVYPNCVWWYKHVQTNVGSTDDPMDARLS